jgi:hypothetical protein
MPGSFNIYAYKEPECFGGEMPRPKKLKRKSFFIDEEVLSRARRVVGAATEAEVVRLSLERMVEMESFWRFMSRNRGKLKPGSFESP